MMRRVRRGAGLLCLLLMAACGGGGHEAFLDEVLPTPDPNRTPGPQGDAAIIEFVAPDDTTDASSSSTLRVRGATLTDGAVVFVPEIGPVGSDKPQSSLLEFRVLNSAGRPAKNGIIVDFTLEGPADARLTTTEARTRDGFVSTILTAGETPGNATVVARVRGTNLVARSAAVVIGRPRTAAVALEFFGLRVPDLPGNADDEAGTPQTRTQLGIRGSGVNQAVDAVFLVLDAGGAAALDGTIVDFTLFGPNGGESVSPASTTSASGFVSATIFTGTRPGPVQIEARVRGTAIVARAIPVTIGGALNPPASNLSVAAQCLNVAGSVTFGLLDDIRAGVSDQFNNPIPIESAVSFFTEGGGIIGQGLTNDRLSATATLVTQAPLPADRRVTVIAVTTGQENFTDLNGNGQFDVGEPFVDIGPEPLLDANEDGLWEPGEFFIDQNNNGLFDATPNGVWDDQILISDSIPIIFSGHTVLEVDPTTFAIPAGGSQVLTLFVGDEFGNPLVGGSTITIEGTNVSVSPTEIVISDTDIDTTFGPVPGLTQFTIILTDSSPEPDPEATPGPSTGPKPASVTIEVTSEIDNAENRCPGGNGNASVTISGTVGG